MKYKIAAVVISLTLIIGLGVAEQLIIKDTMDEMLSRLDSFIVEEDEVYDLDAVGAEDFDSAQALLTRIRMTCREFETVYSVRIGNII